MRLRQQSIAKIRAGKDVSHTRFERYLITVSKATNFHLNLNSEVLNLTLWRVLYTYQIEDFEVFKFRYIPISNPLMY